MKSSGNSAKRKYCTSISWASRENPQVRTKVQCHSSTVRAKKAHQVLTHLTDKFTVSTRMDADHQKIGREISDLRDQKARTRDMTLEKIITKPEVVTQFEVEAGAKFRTYLFIACFMREILIIGQGIVPSFLSPKRR
jgi:phage pi2 protein 07